MIINWLKKNTKAMNDLSSFSIKHNVLGTAINATLEAGEDEILFGCGCFWGAEKGFWKLPGVITTAVGYAGGTAENPTYNQVCSGRTGHTEVVRVTWKKKEVDLSDLLKLFWECHDPTQGNRQGNDRGSQYRSAIYTFNKQQLDTSKESLKSYQRELNNAGFQNITTEIKENQRFYYAENYHQQYLSKPGSRPYCSAMPTKVALKDFKGSNYLLNQEIWNNYNWDITHCVLRSNNEPIKKVV